MHETIYRREAFDFVLNLQVKFAVGHHTYGYDENEAFQSIFVFLFSVLRKTSHVIIESHAFDINESPLFINTFGCCSKSKISDCTSFYPDWWQSRWSLLTNESFNNSVFIRAEVLLFHIDKKSNQHCIVVSKSLYKNLVHADVRWTRWELYEKTGSVWTKSSIHPFYDLVYCKPDEHIY